MVFTHIPSSLLLILAASAPPSLGAAPGARDAVANGRADAHLYVMAVVTPPERPSAESVTAVPRSLASSARPRGNVVLGLPLVICGTLKIIYDVALLFSFRHVNPPEEV